MASESEVAGSSTGSNNDDPSNRDESSRATRATPASAVDAKYIIWARKGTLKEDADGFHNTLVGIVGNKDEVEFLVNKKNIPYAWLAALTAAQLDKVRADGVVDRVEADVQLRTERPGDTAATRKRDNVQRRPSDDKPIIDLRMLSTPPQTPLLDYYAYDDSAGEGITIYMIDSGPFNFEHSELQPLDSSITRDNIDVMDSPGLIDDNSYHGTCVVSKAVGNKVGVARRANLITIRIDITPGKFRFIKAWETIRDDIKSKGLHGKAVVSSSAVFVATNDLEYNRKTLFDLQDLVQSITEMDVPVICPAGNSADKPKGSIEPNTLPAVLAERLPIIVVGSAAVSGTMSRFSQRGKLLTTWAVGEEIQCADRSSESGLLTTEGTSVAAPQIAGLAAYFMSHPKFRLQLRPGTVAKDMQSLIRRYAHPRARAFHYPGLAWNGFRPA
ncbi:serine proteinase 2 [Colletotrichum higginsianum]|uniref:Serine proteinase 2 n=1 Tax=Colletotrichum higginsianum (strain IMI 349063) TaxID=759273 RepID=H1UVZ5_COLHI|nr:Serine proteinase 2 [Colletotrichum higginsianum IMI 349063]OBR05094.1 Serine proteinase 2 [Colletotrichum higginsianum IMI 349063]CCF32146.1 serine proteinase 2 [Colletotrichum higginsianum]